MKWLAGFVVGVLTLAVIERLASQGAPWQEIAGMVTGIAALVVAGVAFLIEAARHVGGA